MLKDIIKATISFTNFSDDRDRPRVDQIFDMQAFGVA
jgi:hypothetical protein